MADLEFTYSSILLLGASRLTFLGTSIIFKHQHATYSPSDRFNEEVTKALLVSLTSRFWLLYDNSVEFAPSMETAVT